MLLSVARKKCFESSKANCAIFDLLKVSLLHSWMERLIENAETSLYFYIVTGCPVSACQLKKNGNSILYSLCVSANNGFQNSIDLIYQ